MEPIRPAAWISPLPKTANDCSSAAPLQGPTATHRPNSETFPVAAACGHRFPVSRQSTLLTRADFARDLLSGGTQDIHTNDEQWHFGRRSTGGRQQSSRPGL